VAQLLYTPLVPSSIEYGSGILMVDLQGLAHRPLKQFWSSCEFVPALD
jgi:hypothetical protein